MLAGSSLAAVLFGLAASASWGTSDFSGGLATRRTPLVVVMVASYAVGLALLCALGLALAEALPPRVDLLWGAAAGCAGALGLTAQYRALAVGRMGIVAPVAAVLGAALPVVFSMFTEGLPGPVRIAGFGLAVASLWLIARPQVAQQDGPSGLGLAVLAGMGFSGFFILADQVNEGAVFWPLAAARGVSLGIMIGIGLASRRVLRPERSALSIIILAGILDVGGNTFFLLATQTGRLDVATILSSLYPAVTVLLARTLLKEHVSRQQATGILIALIAIPLIAV